MVSRKDSAAIERGWWEEQAQFTSGPAGKDQAKEPFADDEEGSVSWQVLPAACPRAAWSSFASMSAALAADMCRALTLRPHI